MRVPNETKRCRSISSASRRFWGFVLLVASFGAGCNLQRGEQDDEHEAGEQEGLGHSPKLEPRPLTLSERAWSPSGRPQQNFIPGDCCEVHEAPACEATPVADCVCAIEPACCSDGWSEECVDAVPALSCGTCGGRGEAGPECGSPECHRSWCGSAFHNACPEEWATNRGCDCGCQFADPACGDAVPVEVSEMGDAG